ncbi:ROK family transcriptional regulator [Clostridium omnivorum]|uniref:Serine/threonine protein kinase n=1 Tax=Clostridium omnivorum TaxID=1604902 RepID=A0ABQ5N2L3_9CLOT|nr:ROK family transcriptional regulator [Clostridium sp. E14]GLC29434.1 serine/threonine protein kinase [Clostridium sp. E14]
MDTTTGKNMATVKLQNRQSILNILKNYGAISRADIAKKLNLTPAAITIIVNDLVKEGVIQEVGQLEEEDKRSGRKKVLIDINYDFKYVIGINIESDYINIGVSNIKCETKVFKRFPIGEVKIPEEFLENVASYCMNMLWKENILKEDILGVGVGIVGHVEDEQGISKQAFGLWKKSVPIKKILEKHLGIPVVVGNNVRTLALGELDYNSKANVDNMMFIKYGPGIGAALIINNELYNGSYNSPGEIGHSIVDYNGKKCSCGRHGCLETLVSQKALIEEISPSFSKEATPILYELASGDIDNLSLRLIAKAAEMGGKTEGELFDKALYFTAVVIGNSVSLYDPHRVVLYGEVFKYDFIVNKLKEHLNNLFVDIEWDKIIDLSVLNNKSNFIGAVALALREFFYKTGAII